MANFSSFSFYKNMSQKNLTVGTSEASFPAPSLTDEVKQPEAIFVQAIETNTVPIIVGKTGVLSDLTQGGFYLKPDSNMILPYNKDEELKAIASAAGQVLLITYLAGAN